MNGNSNLGMPHTPTARKHPDHHQRHRAGSDARVSNRCRWHLSALSFIAPPTTLSNAASTGEISNGSML
jgi:hypothetical protein